MNKFFNKSLATSLTTFLFLVMGTTGVFMFFHILDNFTKDMHEIMGLAFVAIVFLHVFFNWKSMKSYFGKKVFSYSAVIILVVSSGFIINIIASPENGNVKRTIIVSVLSAPLDASLLLFNSDLQSAKEKLERAGLKMGNAKTFQELARENRTSPFNIVGIITNK
jgi:predicted membrane channel-forming protein YqfA (hemolysin III family)